MSVHVHEPPRGWIEPEVAFDPWQRPPGGKHRALEPELTQYPLEAGYTPSIH